jgi:ribosomal protein S18 acetylase RimI-like enzyme
VSRIRIRGYAAADEAGLIGTWNAAIDSDPISAAVFRRKVLLDPNFDPAGCVVAEVDGAVRGLVLSVGRRVPFFNQGLQAEEAWITAFGVHPQWREQKIGTQMLEAVLQRLRNQGRTTVTVSSYVPNYFIPGVDVAAYAPAVSFLEGHGFVEGSRPLSMRAELTGFRIPEPVAQTAARLWSEGVDVRPAEPADILPVLDFVRQHFSWDWYREAADVLSELFAGDPRQVNLLVATHSGQVVGYAQHRAERFGPFGVNPALRSRGIGRVLLARTLVEMLKHGYHAAWFLWTSDNAARLYAQCGFHEVRRFAVMKRSLATEL